MPAYIIVDVTIHDPATYEDYKKLTPASLLPFDGKFIVRGGTAEVLEGNHVPGRVVVLEFPTMDRARDWWSSKAYAPAKLIRQRAAYTNMVLVEGFDQP